MSDYQKQAREEMETAGVKVKPNPNGGFDALNIPNCDLCWGATEDAAWAQAWAFYSIGPINPPTDPS